MGTRGSSLFSVECQVKLEAGAFAVGLRQGQRPGSYQPWAAPKEFASDEAPSANGAIHQMWGKRTPSGGHRMMGRAFSPWRVAVPYLWRCHRLA